MDGLATTNLLLGIMAAVSLLEACVVIGMGVVAWKEYHRIRTLVADLEQQKLAPTMMRVNAILDDLRGVTTTVREETERVDQAIRDTMHRVDDTAVLVRRTMRVKTIGVVAVLRGVRAAAEHLLRSRHQEAEGHS